MIQVVAPQGFRRPAGILQNLLGRHGQPRAVVCYGMQARSNAFPTLNNAPRLNKLHQGKKLDEHQVPVVKHLTNTEALRSNDTPPMFGRRLQHYGGKDIMLALSNQEVQDRIKAGAEFFTVYEPSLEEMRVWVYRRRHLASYKKVLQYPERYKKIGRNYRNGWSQMLMRQDEVDQHRGAIKVAGDAVHSLGLDFGAVDLLVTGNTRRPYIVLEVNSAPGVEGPRQGMTALATKILRWEALGFPKRSEGASRQQT